jgi:hypothetical protein
MLPAVVCQQLLVDLPLTFPAPADSQCPLSAPQGFPDSITDMQTTCVQTLGLITAMHNDGVDWVGRTTEAVGLEAMRDDRVRHEKPNVRRKYLSPDEARRVIEAAGEVGRQPDRDKLLLTPSNLMKSRPARNSDPIV